jgi:hypothetical protein
VLQRALDRLLSLHDGDRGVLDVAAYGQRALPALRRLLFRREPSGLYQPRCRVVEVLAALGEHEVLIDFLESSHEIADPVEAAGEDAVVNAAARALRGLYDERVFRLLFFLAESRLLAGPIEVLGSWRRLEALPCLVAALADDLARPAAVEALRHYGDLATAALLDSVRQPVRVAGAETESSRRRRRAALALLLDLDPSAHVPADLRGELMCDDDAALSVLGCRLALACGTDGERRIAVERLTGWRGGTTWLVRKEIEDCLVANSAIASPIIAKLTSGVAPHKDGYARTADGQRALRRIAARMQH